MGYTAVQDFWKLLLGASSDRGIPDAFRVRKWAPETTRVPAMTRNGTVFRTVGSNNGTPADPACPLSGHDVRNARGEVPEWLNGAVSKVVE